MLHFVTFTWNKAKVVNKLSRVRRTDWKPSLNECVDGLSSESLYVKTHSEFRYRGFFISCEL